MNFRVAHIVPGPLGGLNGALFSQIPSVRMRCLSLLPELKNVGIGGRVLIEGELGTATDARGLSDCAIAVIHKPSTLVPSVLSLLERAGVPVVLDLCDETLLKDPDTLARAHGLTVSSPGLARLLIPRVRCPVWFVPDAVEGPEGGLLPPTLPETPKLVWFGFRKNIAPLIQMLASRQIQNAELEIVTDGIAAIHHRASDAGISIPVTLTEWSPRSQSDALARAHVALLPRLRGRAGMNRSANRVQQALWAGRVTVSSTFEGDGPFRDRAVISDDLIEGLEWVRHSWATSVHQTALGQDWVAGTFTPKVLAGKWTDVLSSVLRMGHPRAMRL